MHSLRKALGADRIVTRAPGYLVRVEPEELDAERFEQLVSRRPDELRGGARALARPALADVATSRSRAPTRRGSTRRGSRRSRPRIAAELERGRHAALVGELDALVAAHPHRERLRAQLMVALYRSRSAGGRARRGPRARTRALDALDLEPSAELCASSASSLTTPDSRCEAESTTVRAVPCPSASAADRPELDVAAVRAAPRPPRHAARHAHRARRHRQDAARARRRGDGWARASFVDLSRRRTDAGSSSSPRSHARSVSSEAPRRDDLETVAAAIGGEPDAARARQLRAGARSPSRRRGRARRGRAAVAVSLRAARRSASLPSACPPSRRYMCTVRHAARRWCRRRDAALRRALARPARGLRASQTRTRRRCETSGARGLPLALELAAARVRSLGPEGTAERLGERLSLLSRGARDLPERQRSLRATLDWSVQLLDDERAAPLAVLGAFSGGARSQRSRPRPRRQRRRRLEDLLDVEIDDPHLRATTTPRFGCARRSASVLGRAAHRVGESADPRPASRLARARRG